MWRVLLALIAILVAKAGGFAIESHSHVVAKYTPAILGITVTPMMVALLCATIVTVIMMVKAPALVPALVATSVTEFVLMLSPYMGLSYSNNIAASWYIGVPLCLAVSMFLLDRRSLWYVSGFWRFLAKLALPTGLMALNVMVWNVYQTGALSFPGSAIGAAVIAGVCIIYVTFLDGSASEEYNDVQKALARLPKAEDEIQKLKKALQPPEAKAPANVTPMKTAA